MLYNLHFFSSKCRLFHNATLFGFCITYILNTVCTKIWKKKSVARRLTLCIGHNSIHIASVLCLFALMPLSSIHHFLIVCPLILILVSVVRLHSITQTPTPLFLSLHHFNLHPTFSGTQLGHKTWLCIYAFPLFSLRMEADRISETLFCCWKARQSTELRNQIIFDVIWPVSLFVSFHRIRCRRASSLLYNPHPLLIFNVNHS